MCGIVGFYGSGNQKLISTMAEVMHKRGPDETGFYVNETEKVYLGHKRLSIIDLKGGKQPMANPKKSMYVVFNGEIYNHRELRVILERKGYKFKSNYSDTEVILHGYEEWGEKVVQYLNGMFSFAIYLPYEKYLFLARDRFGEKPLYYFHDKDCFVFSSDLNALKTHFKVSKTINKLSLQKYFAYGYIPSPLTIYNKVFKVEPGSFIKFNIKTSSITIKKYFDFKIEPDDSFLKYSVNDISSELTQLISNSTKNRMQSDVPLGFFLSGGLDSSLIVAMAKKLSTTDLIRTFSVKFEKNSFDESKYAQQVSDFLGTKHYTEFFDEKALLDLVDYVLPKIDEPLADSSLLPSYLIAKSAKKHVNVVLTGDGADELFGGYAPLKALKPSMIYSKFIPKSIHNLFLYLSNHIPVSHSYMSFDFKVKRTLMGLSNQPNLWNPIWMSNLSKDQIQDILMEPVDLEEIYSEAIELWDSSETKNEIDKSLEFYTKLYLSDNILAKVDRSSMMNSLECRAPYLDNDVVEFARKLPNKFKINKNNTKYILKKTAEDFLPKNIIYKKKQGFSIPIGQWLKDSNLQLPNANIVDVNNKNSILVNREMINSTLESHKTGKKDHRLSLFNILTLQKLNIINY